MIVKTESLSTFKMENARGGMGTTIQHPFLENLEIQSKLTGFNLMVLEPSVSIGYHQHVGSEELYYILEGNPTVVDDGNEEIVGPGAVIWTSNGHFHSLANNTDKVVKFLAFVVVI